GVLEYWLIDWRTRSVEVYRRQGADLCACEILGTGDTLDTPLLPGFSCSVDSLFARIPEAISE
ncbi:MAG: Uma2 family endonuclease, partial [Blastocatellia bacterium]